MRLTSVTVAVMLAGCGGRALQDIGEVGQSTGEILASIDEVAPGGALATRMFFNTPKQLAPGILDVLADELYATAHADPGHSCFTEKFSTCSSGSRTRDFGGCDLGSAKMTGTVTLTFSEATCSFALNNSTITRKANFTITGPKGGSISVAVPGTGQKLTRTGANTYTYGVDGINRSAKDPNGKAIFDFTVKTLEDIAITGSNRSERTLNGGKIEVVHNLAKYTSTFTPNNLKWAAGCVCPTSGTLTGTVVGSGATRDVTIEVTGCGTGTITVKKAGGGETAAAEDTENFTFERCGSL